MQGCQFKTNKNVSVTCEYSNFDPVGNKILS